jgi:hypothetical protein
MRIARSAGSQLNVTDGASNPGVPSAIVITERLEVGTGVVFNINDNDVRYVGQNVANNGTDGTRGIVINTDNMSGT